MSMTNDMLKKNGVGNMEITILLESEFAFIVDAL
jgi:hypothetical protein